MPEPFKNKLDGTTVKAMADHLKRVAPDFDGDGFVKFTLRELETLELKQRSTRITEALERFLPRCFPDAVGILLASLDPVTGHAIGETVQGISERGIRGWPVMAMADFVAKQGRDEVDLSLSWATRLPAFIADPSPVLSLLERLKDDPSEYVRHSVANNLNDIAKDHPDLIVELAR